MKLVGSMVTVNIHRTVGGTTVSAGLRFRDIDLGVDPPVVDVGTANSGGERFVDASGATATLSATAVPDDTDGHNFWDLYQEGGVVTVDAIKGVSQDKLDSYGPWQMGPAGLRHQRAAASEERIQLIGTRGAVASTYDPTA